MEVVEVALMLEMMVVVQIMVEDSAKAHRREKETMEVVDTMLQTTHMVVIEVGKVVNKMVVVATVLHLVKAVIPLHKLMEVRWLVGKVVLLDLGEAVAVAVLASSVEEVVQMMVIVGEDKAVVLDLLS